MSRCLCNQTVDANVDTSRVVSTDGNPINTVAVRYDPTYAVFGLIGHPVAHDQHPNQQNGLDLYVSVVNFQTGETCFKKLYRNNHGIYFKHTGYRPMYLDNFTAEGFIVPFQVLINQDKSDE